MNNDKKNIKKDNQDNNWAENLKEDLSKLDTDFPLSGGEEPDTPIQDTDAALEEDEEDELDSDR